MKVKYILVEVSKFQVDFKILSNIFEWNDYVIMTLFTVTHIVCEIITCRLHDVVPSRNESYSALRNYNVIIK